MGTIAGDLPGARELLAALPRDRWAIVTSCGRDLARLRLGTAGLPVPATLIVAEEVKPGKPAPDGYLLGAGLMIAAALTEVAIGIKAERQPLESVARPLSALPD